MDEIANEGGCFAHRPQGRTVLRFKNLSQCFRYFHEKTGGVIYKKLKTGIYEFPWGLRVWTNAAFNPVPTLPISIQENQK